MKTNKTKVSFLFAIVALIISANLSFSQLGTPAYVDFDAFEKLVSEVKEHRKTHMLTTQEFKSTSQQEKVIILDTRSDSAYAAVHIKGAIHLNFSDFTQDNLAKVIPSPDYKILIYCNNNFNITTINVNKINPIMFENAMATKSARPFVPINLKEISLIKPEQKEKSSTGKKQKGPNQSIELEKSTNEVPKTTESELKTTFNKPLTLALNIPTYINLYGYGYKNVFELSELVNTYDNIIEFEGTAVIK